MPSSRELEKYVGLAFTLGLGLGVIFGAVIAGFALAAYQAGAQ